MNLLNEVQALRQLWTGFWSSRVLLTANNIGVFDHLKSPKSASALALILRTDKRATEILLDALTGLGLLKKSGDKYKNSTLSSKFLIISSECSRLNN